MHDATSVAVSEPAPPSGFVFPPRVLEISRERQNHKLSLCGAEPAIWGDAGDPTFLGMYAIMAQRWSGRSINGNAHMTQIYRLNSPVPLNQSITMAGEVSRVDPHPRGAQVFADFGFALNDGSVPLRASRSSLNPGPGDSSGRRVATPSDPLAGMSQINEVQLIPENVASFLDEAENLIHSDPAIAERFGFPAPIAGGLMASHIMLGAVIDEAGCAGPVTGLEMDIRCLHPLYWDKRVRVLSTSKDAPGPRCLVVVAVDGKPKNLHTINAIHFG
jgi:hypothetical protein